LALGRRWVHHDERKRGQHEFARGINGERVSHDVRRLHGVTVYGEEEHTLSMGHACNLRHPTAPSAPPTATSVPSKPSTVRITCARGWKQAGPVTVGDGGRTQLDHGYAVTSHSSEGQTLNRRKSMWIPSAAASSS
jgi:hypothetical protein